VGACNAGCNAAVGCRDLISVDAGLLQVGKTPAILFSLPGNQSQLLALDAREITRLVRLVTTTHPGCAVMMRLACKAAGMCEPRSSHCRSSSMDDCRSFAKCSI
jgi:hypothetical protein